MRKEKKRKNSRKNKGEVSFSSQSFFQSSRKNDEESKPTSDNHYLVNPYSVKPAPYSKKKKEKRKKSKSKVENYNTQGFFNNNRKD